MKNLLAEIVTNASQNKPVAFVISTVTTSGAGVGTYLDKIPFMIGVIATTLGAILSLVLIVTHIFKMSRDKKEHMLRIEILEIQRNNSKTRSTDI